uniref:Uncharacterized protein n=1 Tax=Meloidogyne floridensis TaxID=298350 RepID=A0A915NK17_9BILA
MKLLIIYLIPLFITSIVSHPKHTRDSPDGDPNKRRNVSGESDTGTGTSNPDATTSTGMPSSQEQQTSFFGLDEIFSSHNQQEQQPLTSYGSSFPPFDLPDYTQQQQSLGSLPPYYPSNMPSNSTQPLYTPPATTYGEYGSYQQVNPSSQGDYDLNPWPESNLFIKDNIEEFLGSVPEGSVSKQADQTIQTDYNPTFDYPLFSPTPYTPHSFFDYQHEHPTPAFVGDDVPWHEESHQDVQPSKQAVQVDPKSQLDPKDKKQKPKGSRIDRANRYVKGLGLKQKFKFQNVKGGILGTCLICKNFNGKNVQVIFKEPYIAPFSRTLGERFDFRFTVNMGKEVEDCIEQHINTENHQDAIRSEGITSSEPQSEQQQQPDISVPTESNF